MLSPVLAGTAALAAIGPLTKRIRWSLPLVALAALALSTYFALTTPPGAFHLVPGRAEVSSGLKVDPLTVYVSLLVLMVSAAVVLYSYPYAAGEVWAGRYYILLLAFTAGALGVALSDDLFTLYVFWELMVVSSYALIGIRGDAESSEASFKYMLLSTLSSLALLLSLAIVYGATGSLSFSSLRSAVKDMYLGGELSWRGVAVMVGLTVVGFAVCVALVPFHVFTPDAYTAPLPSVGALLSGAATKAGAYALAWTLFRVFDPRVFDYGPALIAVALLTMTVGNLTAVMQTDGRRLLSYSSIANLGYIVLGLGVGAYALNRYGPAYAAPALAGSLLHFLNHALGKGAAFMSLGNLEALVGSRGMSRLEGSGGVARASGAALSIAMLNLAGIPPLAGFWSKLLIAAGCLAVPGDPILTAALVVFIANCVLAAGYYLWFVQRVVLRAFRGEPRGPVPLLAEVTALTLAAACLVVTLLLHPVLSFVYEAAACLAG